MNDMNDLKFAFRQLLKNPGFTAVAVLTLALGIGATTAIFSVVHAVLLRPLPVYEPDRLVFIGERSPTGRNDAVSASNFSDLRQNSKGFEQIGAHRGIGFTLTGTHEPAFISGTIVSDNFLSLLGIRPAMGRGFLPAEAQKGSGRVAVVSYEFWQGRLGGASDVLGRTLTLDGESHSITGVLPAGFRLFSAEVWVPGFGTQGTTNRASRMLSVIGRLNPGVSLEEARAELATVALQLEAAHPDSNKGWRFRAETLHEAWYGGYRPALLLLLVTAGFVLLIGCANVANLLLVRAISREREFAIRSALGAGRVRLARQLLTESILLGLIGCIGGILLAQAGLRFLVAVIPGNMLAFGVPGGAESIRIDAWVFAFGLGVSVLNAVLFGLAPVAHCAKANVGDSLKKGPRMSGSPRSRRFSHALVVGEMALSLTLMVGSGLMIQSFARFRGMDRGHDSNNVLSLSVSLPAREFAGDHQRRAFVSDAIERLESLPGVQTAASHVLESARGRPLHIEDRPAVSSGDELLAMPRVISPRYFSVLSIPLLKGRDFSTRDTTNAPAVCIINQALAKRISASVDPIGKRVRFASPPGTDQSQWLQIVGVVGDIRETLDPRSPLNADPRPTIYRSFHQNPIPGSLLVRSSGDPTALIPAIRRELAALNPNVPITRIQTGREGLAESLAQPRFHTLLLSVFAGLALLLAAVGIYGVISYSVTQRAREVGIRMALGAQQSDVLRLIVSQGMRLTLVGLALGLGGAFALTSVMSNLLYGITPTDPATFAGVTLLLALVALLACWLPARRAARVDPMVALRQE
jgi:predicted permease